jgi:hypothetical protein
MKIEIEVTARRKGVPLERQGDNPGTRL